MTNDEKTPQETWTEERKRLVEEIRQSVPFIVLPPDQIAALKKALGEDV